MHDTGCESLKIALEDTETTRPGCNVRFRIAAIDRELSKLPFVCIHRDRVSGVVMVATTV